MHFPGGILIAGLLLAGSADAVRAPGRIAGCIARAAVRHSEVQSDRRIDFHLRDGGKVRNDLPAACQSLLFTGQFDLSGSGQDICPGDAIFVPNRAWAPGEYVGATCALGAFSTL